MNIDIDALLTKLDNEDFEICSESESEPSCEETQQAIEHYRSQVTISVFFLEFSNFRKRIFFPQKSSAQNTKLVSIPGSLQF